MEMTSSDQYPEQERLERMYDTVRALYRAKRYEDVLESVQDILAEDANDLLALLYRSRSLLSLGQHEEAEACARHMLAVDPDNEDGLCLMGDIHSSRNELDEAAVYYEQCIAKDPEDIDYRYALARVVLSGIDRNRMYKRFPSRKVRPEAMARLQRGLDVLQEANRLFPGNSEGHWMLAQCYDWLCKPDEAMEHLRSAIVLNPSDAEVHARMADYFIYNGDLATARSHCEQALALDPHHANSLFFMDLIKKFQRNQKLYYRKLVNYQQSLCDMYPDDAANWLRLAQTKQSFGKEPPVKELKTYVKLKPEDWDQQFAYGKALYDDKMYWSARSHFRQLEKELPGNSAIAAWQDTLAKISMGAYIWSASRMLVRKFAVEPLKHAFHLVLIVPLAMIYQFMNDSKSRK
ncbi:tetratricopeptide repeat protein [Paenibacillus ginsengihumi]|uniref:tetratricopeptide repeat protein n=1 Tax=Paenibacillus ginsengihumi TaxID=431596 RepID=UPI0012EBC8CF|nr:tetratricopeptide repeat protein [Paenibacillus ginsengihumi]